jgi:hypothetical protein
MPIPQVPQFPVYRFICIFIGPKYILTYHPHTFDPQGLSQPRIYTSNSPCPRSGRAVRGSQLRAAQFRIYGVVFDIIDAKPIGLHPTNTPHQLGPSHRAKHYPSSQCYGPTSSDRGSQLPPPPRRCTSRSAATFRIRAATQPPNFLVWGAVELRRMHAVGAVV